jgi:hypothetical protein
MGSVPSLGERLGGWAGRKREILGGGGEQSCQTQMVPAPDGPRLPTVKIMRAQGFAWEFGAESAARLCQQSIYGERRKGREKRSPVECLPDDVF